MTAQRKAVTAPKVKVSKSLREAVLRRDGYRCTRCGRTSPEVLLTVDHIVPASHGGSTVLSNLRTYCHTDNSRRGNRALRTATGGYVR